MLLTEAKQATIEDYERLPEGSPYQLIAGELIMTPSPTPFHQDILVNLAFTLREFARKNKLGKVFIAPLDIRMSNHDVYQPDILFVRKERVGEIGRKKFNIIPDLVIEILSESTAYYDFTRKKQMYCKNGVSEYWIVDPEAETIEIMAGEGEYYRTEAIIGKTGKLESPMFPGFSMNVEDVFAF